MKAKRKYITMYESEDGKLFGTEDECLQYEALRSGAFEWAKRQSIITDPDELLFVHHWGRQSGGFTFVATIDDEMLGFMPYMRMYYKEGLSSCRGKKVVLCANEEHGFFNYLEFLDDLIIRAREEERLHDARVSLLNRYTEKGE